MVAPTPVSTYLHSATMVKAGVYLVARLAPAFATVALVTLFDATGELQGSVYGVEYLGTNQIVTIDTDYGQLKARIPAAARIAPGETVGLALDSARLSLFDATTGRAIRSALHG